MAMWLSLKFLILKMVVIFENLYHSGSILSAIWNFVASHYQFFSLCILNHDMSEWCRTPGMLSVLESRVESSHHHSSEHCISSNMAKCYFTSDWSGGHVHFCFRPSISSSCPCALAKWLCGGTRWIACWLTVAALEREVLLFMSVWHFVELEFCLL